MTRHRPGHPDQRGAALLTAMVIVTLVATLAAAMVWQQWRAVQVEAAERARSQAQWILVGAIDWARLILREDARSGKPTSLGEPWATPLAEAKLSTFLAADRDNTDDAPDAFLSGSIIDAQSHYNLRNLMETGARAQEEEKVLQRLLELVGARGDLAPVIARALRDAAPPVAPEPGSTAQPAVVNPNPPLMPQRVDQLIWLGVDAESLAQLAPFVTLLPVSTTVNLNTAPKEVLAAVIPGLDLASAERLVQGRGRNAFKSADDAKALLPSGADIAKARVAVKSDFFEVRGRLRLQERTIEERVLVQRSNLDIIPLTRQRLASVDTLGS